MHPEALFHVGNLGVYAYGICYAAGIILCFVFLMFAMKIKKFNEQSSDVILLVGVIAVGIGVFSGMLFQALYDFIDNPSGGFHITGSMTFIGGLIGGVVSFVGIYLLYVYLIAPRTKIKMLQNNMNASLTDALPFIPIGIVIAHSIGRLGCFFGGCCYGKPTDAWFGIACSAPGRIHSETLVIPTQLFECLFLAALAAVMAFLYFKYRFNYNFSLYLISYGIWRFVLEYFRGDYRGEFIGSALYPSQIWSIVMVAAGIGYIFMQKYVFQRYMKHPELEVSDPAADGKKEQA